jgi:hypothetical protein
MATSSKRTIVLTGANGTMALAFVNLILTSHPAREIGRTLLLLVGNIGWSLHGGVYWCRRGFVVFSLMGGRGEAQWEVNIDMDAVLTNTE